MIKGNYYLFIICLIFWVASCRSQEIPANLPEIENIEFSERLERLLSYTVPVIGVQELAKEKNQYLILDTREKEEFKVSHIPGALHAGYKKFNWEILDNIPKDQPILLYCSVGYRSEKMGEQLKGKGYQKVYNLYGSIFEWANEDLPLEDHKGNTTQKIHTYNSRWSKWVEEGELIKVW